MFELGLQHIKYYQKLPTSGANTTHEISTTLDLTQFFPVVLEEIFGQLNFNYTILQALLTVLA